MKSSFRVLFFGSDAISLKTLQALRSSQKHHAQAHGGLVSHLEVVCPPDRPSGRGLKLKYGPVKDFSLQEGLTVHQPNKLKTLKDWSMPTAVDDQPFDIGVVTSFRYLIPPTFINSFRKGAINMHPSLLPKYRGPAPIIHTLLNDEKTTGVSIIELNPSAFDSGKILAQHEYPVHPEATYGTLSMELAELGARSVIDVLARLDEARASPVSRDQDEAMATHAPKVTTEMGEVDFSELSVHALYNLWRGIGDTVGIYASFKGQRTQLVHFLHPSHTHNLHTLASSQPGSFVYSKRIPNSTHQGGVLLVRCTDGVIACTRVHVQNKKEASAADFVNGYHLNDGTHLFEKVVAQTAVPESP